MGAQPSAWMTASLGMWLISPMAKSSLKPWIYAQRSNPAAHRLDIPVRGRPAKLFHDLIGNGFHRFAGGNGAGAAVEQQVPPLGKLGGDLFGLVITAAHTDDFRPKERRLTQFFLRDQAGHEDPQLDPRPGTGSSISNSCIAGGGDDRLAYSPSAMAATATAAWRSLKELVGL